MLNKGKSKRCINCCKVFMKVTNTQDVMGEAYRAYLIWHSCRWFLPNKKKSTLQPTVRKFLLRRLFSTTLTVRIQILTFTKTRSNQLCNKFCTNKILIFMPTLLPLELYTSPQWDIPIGYYIRYDALFLIPLRDTRHWVFYWVFHIG